ncbi:MAG TPA: PAS domain S-box protein [Prolixibacteraceae bacterium]|mgnify:FL=1|nr:PAS domain S-box protein [Prolixibacteraceae bacterium]
MTGNKPSYHNLEQRITLLEQELRDKNERLLLLQEKNNEREHKIEDITSNFETFFNTIDDFLFVIDEQGNILHCNKTVEKRLGYTADELKGKSILSVHPEDRRSETVAVSADVIAGKLASFQIPLVTKQGNQICVETRASSGCWNGKPAFFGVSKDISKLKLSKEKFATLFRSSPDTIMLSRLSDGEIIEVNDSASINLGYSKEELIGKSTLQLNIWVNPEDRKQYVELLTKNHRVKNFEVKFKMKSGEIKVGLISSEIIQLFNDFYHLSITRDITDRKKVEEEIIKKNAEYYTLNAELTESLERIQRINTQHEKAKEIAEENERKFSIAFHNSLSISLISNIDTGEILEANDASEQIGGFSRTELIGNSVINLNLWMIDGDRDKFIEILVRDKKVLNFESKFRKKNGEAFIGLISGQMIQIQNQNCLLSIIHDITDRKNVEKELLKAKENAEESEEKFKNLYDSLSISYLTLKDGVCIECNEATLAIYGVNSKDDVIGKSPIDFSPEFQLNHLRSSEEAKRHNQTAIEEGFHSFEWLAQRKDKEEFLAEVSLKRYYYKNELYIQCLTTDITERKRIENELIAAEEKAEESEQKYKGLFVNMMNAFGLHEMVFNEKGEPIDYVFLEVNPIWEKVVGIKAGNVIGKRILEIMPNIEQNWIDRYGRIVLTGISEEFVDYNAGTQKYYNVFAYKHEGNKFAVVFNDITDKKQFEQELIVAKEKAEESDRLKTAFLHNMSHEIRTPLNAISGFTGLLNDPDITEEEMNSYIQIIQNSSSQLISIVSDILTISSLETKQEPISISNVCINELFAELQAIFIQQAKNKNISLIVEQQLDNEQSTIYTDRTKLTQILSNLLSNALKFTTGGLIEFGYNLKTSVEPFEIEFYVKDSGIGINPEFHTKIFERFRQANKSINKIYGGTGLGLAISKAFVELLGGKIWVKSELEKGATFYFTLPYNPSLRN